MAETLGSLCDKLTIVKLKQWHTTDPARLTSLAQQCHQLGGEIEDWIREAAGGRVDPARLTFAQNKVYDTGDRTLASDGGGIGELFAKLAGKNCELWHEQEKVYEVQKSPDSHHDAVALVTRLGQLNLERTELIDAIDRTFVAILQLEESNS